MEQSLEQSTELVTTHFCDTIYQHWSVSMTKEELIDYEFNVESFASDNPDRVDMKGSDCQQVEETDQEGPYYEWLEEWEESEDSVGSE